MRIRRPAWLAAFFTFIFTSQAFGFPTAHWQFSGWYGGGCYPSVAVDPTVEGRVYLTSDVAGVWRSDDGGDTWLQKNEGLSYLNVAAIALAPDNTKVVYAATDGGLFVSKNAAETWGPTSQSTPAIGFKRPISARPIAISKQAAGHVCIGTAAGRVLCSSDYGDTWQQAGENSGPFGDSTITALVFSPDETSLWAASAEGLAVLHDGEQAWSKISEGPQGVSDLLLWAGDTLRIITAGNQALWISMDMGKSWQQSANIPRGKTFRVFQIPSVDNDALGIVWNEDWQGGVAVSRDMGQHWQNFNGNKVANKQDNPTRSWASTQNRTTFAAADPQRPGRLFMTDFWGVWRTDDLGKTWSEKIRGAPNTVGSDLYFAQDGRLFVATMDDGLLVSSDHGGNYQNVLNNYSKQTSGHVWRIADISADSTRIVATSSPWALPINQVMIIDKDGNVTVSRQGLPETRPKNNTLWGQGYARALAVDPNNPERVYLGIDGDDGGGLFISDDGAMTWRRSSGQPESRRIYNALAVDPSDSNRILWGACGNKGGVFLSEDAGSSWKRTLTQCSCVYDLAAADNGIFYAAGDQDGAVIFTSKDQGKSWKLLSKFARHSAAEALSVNTKDPKQVVVSVVRWNNRTGGHILISKDSGITWTDITGDLPEGSGAAATVFGPDGYLYISRYAGSVYKLELKSLDGGGS